MKIKIAGVTDLSGTVDFDYATEYDRFNTKDGYWSCVQDHIIIESDIQYKQQMQSTNQIYDDGFGTETFENKQLNNHLFGANRFGGLSCLPTNHQNSASSSHIGFSSPPVIPQNNVPTTVGLSNSPLNRQSKTSDTVNFSNSPLNHQNKVSNKIDLSEPWPLMNTQNKVSNRVDLSGIQWPSITQNKLPNTVGFSNIPANTENNIPETAGFSSGPKFVLFGNNAQQNNITRTDSVRNNGRESGYTFQDTIVSNSVPADMFGGRNVKESYITIDKMVLNPDSFSQACSFGLSVSTHLVLLNNHSLFHAKEKCERLNKQSIIGMQTTNIMDVEEACCVCFETCNKFVSFLPCAHTCLCIECVQRIIKEDGKCPLCRMKIQGYVQ